MALVTAHAVTANAQRYLGAVAIPTALWHRSVAKRYSLGCHALGRIWAPFADKKCASQATIAGQAALVWAIAFWRPRVAAPSASSSEVQSEAWALRLANDGIVTASTDESGENYWSMLTISSDTAEEVTPRPPMTPRGHGQ